MLSQKKAGVGEIPPCEKAEAAVSALGIRVHRLFSTLHVPRWPQKPTVSWQWCGQQLWDRDCAPLLSTAEAAP